MMNDRAKEAIETILASVVKNPTVYLLDEDDGAVYFSYTQPDGKTKDVHLQDNKALASILRVPVR